MIFFNSKFFVTFKGFKCFCLFLQVFCYNFTKGTLYGLKYDILQGLLNDTRIIIHFYLSQRTVQTQWKLYKKLNSEHVWCKETGKPCEKWEN